MILRRCHRLHSVIIIIFYFYFFSILGNYTCIHMVLSLQPLDLTLTKEEVPFELEPFGLVGRELLILMLENLLFFMPKTWVSGQHNYC